MTPEGAKYIAAEENAADYRRVCNQALPSLAELERELAAMREEIREREARERMSPLSDTWMRHHRGQSPKEVICRTSRD